MISHPTVETKSLPPASWRWAVLVAISVAMFGNYYVYDSIAAADRHAPGRQLGFSETQIGTLNAIYSLPNIVMAAMAVSSWIGSACVSSTLVLHPICLAGVVLTALRRSSRRWRSAGCSSALAPSR